MSASLTAGAVQQHSLLSDPWLDVRGAAKFTGYSTFTLYGMVSKASRGLDPDPIPFHKRGRSLRFKASELDAWMRSPSRPTGEN